jgi:hypothetical protein
LWFWSVVQLLVGLLVVLTVDLYDYETIFLIGYGIILISVFCFGICARVVKKTAFWIAFLLFTGGSILTLGLVLNYNTMTGIGGVIAGLGVYLGLIKMYYMT